MIGTCLFYYNFVEKQSGKTLSNKDNENLVFGLLFALKPLCKETSPTGKDVNFHTLRTADYVLHQLFLASGIRLVLFTSVSQNTGLRLRDKVEERALMMEVYKTLFIPFIIQNPLIDVKSMAVNKRRYMLHESKCFINGFSKLMSHSITTT